MSRSCENIIDCLRIIGCVPETRSSPYVNEDHNNSYAIDYGRTSFFFTKGKNTWWSVDFKTRVTIRGYHLVSECRDSWIYNWIAQISDDNRVWRKIDEHVDTCGGNFSFSSPFYGRFFRIFCNGKSVVGGDAMAFTFAKFYGDAFAPRFVFSCATKRKICSSFKMIVFVLNK